MSNLFELLKKIEQKPGLYIGTASVTALRQFLVGYKFARQEMGIMPTEEEELDFYQEFQPWLQVHFSIQTANSWDTIILFKCADGKAAFASFFRLLEQFRNRDKSQDINSILLEREVEKTEKIARSRSANYPRNRVPATIYASPRDCLKKPGF
ncbi:MAG: hypothetical protein JGK17_09230 [Microcoleus sp. PH2017_10_PVI_O_A]|uniref:hypothetical protein n=1 Tax=unclassified Microcoleus TaxID=2642155 RepID=UPI001D608551|nr:MULTISPECIES: hypothetical protein [unclassified Microcoleus]MCC3405758.1 hypothetical protein [Microcoleus sp. PH2017_10_PVI_O_A]MCC3459728.1 hypothetical protein [Microcoleus sp. PH2017_11_PCY_U_A]MCC3477766.1 hypothetical protein [Microcoleus sp. PH2017_12_PCY_D_A]MCC3529844.1 hypothetical protein [Microcoleus sp. PH2017_21_RUC_O_A]MCC3542128.1 hypothetical protein [Microcoleus sp. PH2017_22_RUC_O_B]